MHNAHDAFSQAWPAFALVAGLLLVGAEAAREGVFAEAGALVARTPGGARSLLVALLLLEAAVTAVLNLDTAVVFLTPVLLHAARRRGVDETPFLYGAVFMANSASLLLPGSNLTNLIVLANQHVAGSEFASRLAAAWATAVAVTIVFLLFVFRRAFERPGRAAHEHPPFRPRAGAVGIVVAGVLVLVLARPALPVLAVGFAVALVARMPPRLAVRAANPVLLLGVLALAVALGTAARELGWLGHLVEHASRWESAGIATLASVAINNLPAAVVLSAHMPAHPRALLLGLDLGPNLAITGSLSAVLWLQVARANRAHPSVLRYSRLGIVLVPVSIALSLLAATGS